MPTTPTTARTPTPRAPTPTPQAIPAPAPRAPATSSGARALTGPPAVRLTPTAGSIPERDLSEAVQDVIRSPGPGEPLQPEVKRSLEQRLDVPLAEVRVHRDAKAQAAVSRLGARAFTYGTHVFLGVREQPNDLPLMAHEVTHVIQQQGAPVVQMRSVATAGDHFEREAEQSAAAVQQGQQVTVRARTGGPRVQGLGIRDALDYFADAANNIPGFAMLTFVIGINPINMRRVERNATNLFRAVIGFMPGGELIFQALQRHGIIERVGAWLQQQLNSLGMAASMVRDALDRFLESLSWRDIFRLGSVWDRAKRIFTEPIGRIIGFISGVVSDILGFIRDAILRPVARLAEGTRGYDLLRLILGRDPITDDPYPRTADNLIGGFMRLIGQEEKWRHLQQSRAIPRAWAWFQQQVGTLLGFVRQIPQLFVRLWQALQISDLLDIGGAFNKVRNIFGGFIGSFISWAGNAALQIMMFIFEALAPGAMPILRRAAAVIRTIIGDPIRFVGNLVRAGAQGFRQFANNIRTHLINGLVGWLTGALTGAGLQLPQRWDLRGILSLVLQILGLTWQNLRQKLLRHIPEPVLQGLATTFDIVVTLVRDGPAAAWQKILEQLQNLQEMVFGGIRDWVARTVVAQAVIRIVSMFNPAGAVIQAIIAIYNTIMFVRERLQQIMQVAEAFFNSIAQIASGAIGAAANYVEQTMGRLVPVVISFLARLIGLGGISNTIRNIINRIRAPIDRALDRVVDWIVAQARRLGRAVVGTARGVIQRVAGWLGLRKSFRTVGGEPHSLFFRPRGAGGQLMISSVEMSLESFLAELASKYARDGEKIAKVRTAQGLVDEIKRLTAPGTTPTTAAGASAAVDALVRSKIDQLGPILQEIGDGVSTEGATAAYRGIHYWVNPTQTPAQADAEQQERLRRHVVGAQQLSDAVRVILSSSVPAGTTATPAQIEAAIDAVNAKMEELRDDSPYDVEGKRYYDRFHFLLGRFVMNLDAFRDRIRRAGELEPIETAIATLRGQMGALGRETAEYATAKRRAEELERTKRGTASGVASVYRELRPEVQASPFLSTSTNVRLAAGYAFGKLNKPPGTEKRTVGIIGRILVFVASVQQLVRAKVYSIPELQQQGKILISKDMRQDELTFTAHIPGEYLRATLDVQAGQDENATAGNASSRAQAEAQRFGGLK